jgi:hypothetical protein
MEVADRPHPGVGPFHGGRDYPWKSQMVKQFKCVKLSFFLLFALKASLDLTSPLGSPGPEAPYGCWPRWPSK